jgi:hypothetical protein
MVQLLDQMEEIWQTLLWVQMHRLQLMLSINLFPSHHGSLNSHRYLSVGSTQPLTKKILDKPSRNMEKFLQWRFQLGNNAALCSSLWGMNPSHNFSSQHTLCYALPLPLWHLINCWSYPIDRKNAEDALQGLNGSTIGKQTVRLSWGRNPTNKQVGACSDLLPANR